MTSRLPVGLDSRFNHDRTEFIEMNDIDSILEQLISEKVVVLKGGDEQEILRHLEIVREEDTLISGAIRIFSGEIGFVILEYPNDGSGSIVLHLFSALEAAEYFVQDRLETYERMWDGCGCKIDYYKT